MDIETTLNLQMVAAVAVVVAVVAAVAVVVVVVVKRSMQLQDHFFAQQPGGERHLRQSNTADPKPEESGSGGFVQRKFRFLAKEPDAIQISMPH